MQIVFEVFTEDYLRIVNFIFSIQKAHPCVAHGRLSHWNIRDRPI